MHSGLSLNARLAAALLLCCLVLARPSPAAVTNPVSVRSDVTATVESAGDDASYLLITNETLKTDFQPLVARRTAQGKTGQLLTIEWIGEHYDGTRPDGGSDLQTKIRACIKDYYLNRGTAWVCLGGDESIVPVRTCMPEGTEQPDVTTPGELYYADMDGGSWDLNANGVYGEPQDVTVTELTPEVALGRIPVNSVQQVKDYVGKVVAYESASPDGFSSSMLFLTSANDRDVATGDARPPELRHHDPIINCGYAQYYWNDIQPYWQAVPMHEFYGSHTSFDQSEWGDYPATADHLVDVISRGYHFVTYSGHANPGGWALGDGFFSVSDAMRLSNPIPCIVRAGGCGAAWFDAPGDCLMEGFLHNPSGGAVVVFGHARTAYWALPQDALYQEVFQNGRRNVGDALRHSQADVASAFVDHPYHTLIFVLLGDPAIELLGEPSGRRLQVMIPAGLEEYDEEQDIIIRWNACGTGFAPGENVQLLYSPDSGTTWVQVPGAESLPYNARAFTWVNPGLPVEPHYRIRVVSLSDETAYAASTRDFAVQDRRTLAVRAVKLPDTALPVYIDGTHPNFTDYTHTVEFGEIVVLKSPGVQGSDFVRWADADGGTLTRSTTLSFTCTGDRTVTAEYGPVAEKCDYYVNDETAEPGFAAGNDENDGRTRETPVRHIQEILDRHSDIGTIHVSAGVFAEHLVIDSRGKGLTLQGAGASQTVIDGEDTGRCLMLNSVTGISIRSLAIRNGAASGGYGGGIYSESSTLDISDCVISGCNAAQGGAYLGHNDSVTLRRCTMIGNSAENYGGAIYAWAPTSMALSDCVFQDNRALGSGYGGGLYVDGGTSATVERCDFTHNLAGDAGTGGAIYDRFLGAAISDCTFTDNTAGGGGAVCIDLCTATLARCTFASNRATSAVTGGGGLNATGANVSVNDCVFRQNSGAQAGALCAGNQSQVDITRCTFSDNVSDILSFGGAVTFRDSSGTVRNSCFRGNSGACGGAICFLGDAVSHSVTGCTMADNSGEFGSTLGCYYGASPQIENSILWGSGQAVYSDSESTPAITYCCITGGHLGAGNIGEDPLLLSDRIHLSVASPCIDAGAPDGDYAGCADIDGESRVNDGQVDIGADEFTWSSVSAAKGRPDDSFVNLESVIVTAAFPDFFYTEAEDRSSGIGTESVGHGLSEGNRVGTTGYMRTGADGERYLEALTVVANGSGSLGSIGLMNRNVGGGPSLYDPETGAGQQGVLGGFGLNNIGLLVRTWGKVTQVGEGYLYIDDGSGLRDGTSIGADENLGVRVICDPAACSVGERIEVTGISSCFWTPSGIARRILTRRSEDVRKLAGR